MCASDNNRLVVFRTNSRSAVVLKDLQVISGLERLAGHQWSRKTCRSSVVSKDLQVISVVLKDLQVISGLEGLAGHQWS